METVEIIAYFVASLIIGGFLILFVTGINPNDIFKSLKSVVFPEKELRYDSIESEDLALRAFDLWEKCGLGTRNMSLTLYVKSGAQINKSTIFNVLKKLNLCDSMQSQAESCGKREDILMGKDYFAPPVLINLACDPSNSTLVIS